MFDFTPKIWGVNMMNSYHRNARMFPNILTWNIYYDYETSPSTKKVYWYNINGNSEIDIEYSNSTVKWFSSSQLSQSNESYATYYYYAMI